jgi:hypothetical protein
MLGIANTSWDAGSRQLVYRSDAYSANLLLAVPFSSRTGMTDIAWRIRGSGGSAAVTDGTNTDMNTAQVKWTSSPNYVQSVKSTNTSGQQALTYTLPSALPDATAGSNSYVVEGWFYANDATTNANWALSSADANGRWVFGINTGSLFTFASENNCGIGSGWHHVAIVLDSGTRRFYTDGIYRGAWDTANTGFTTLHIAQFSSTDENDYNGWIQDLRVYSGTNRGYTGTNSGSANFTLPASIIQSV